MVKVGEVYSTSQNSDQLYVLQFVTRDTTQLNSDVVAIWLLLNDKDISDISVREAIIDSSRKNYAIKYTPKEVKLVNVKQSPTKKKKAPVKKPAAASSHHRKLPGEA